VTAQRNTHNGKWTTTTTDPRDDLNYVRSPTTLYTKLDAECDQQATIVGD